MAKVDAGLCSRDQLLGAAKRRFANVNVPGLPAPVRIRNLTELEKSRFECEFLDKRGNTDRKRIEEMRRRLIELCVVDADGNPLLTSADVDALKEIDGGITSAIFTAAQSHCGFGDAELEEARKN